VEPVAPRRRLRGGGVRLLFFLGGEGLDRMRWSAWCAGPPRRTSSSGSLPLEDGFACRRRFFHREGSPPCVMSAPAGGGGGVAEPGEKSGGGFFAFLHHSPVKRELWLRRWMPPVDLEETSPLCSVSLIGLRRWVGSISGSGSA